MDKHLTDAVRAFQEAGGVKQKAADILGIPVSTYKSRLKRAEAAGLLTGGCRRSEYEETDGGSKAKLTAVSDKPVRTIDDLVEILNIDTTTWQVDRWWCGVEGDKHRVTAQVVRIKKPPIVDVIEAAYEKLLTASPKWPKPPKAARITGDNLMVMSLYDVHFGKLGWAPEVGHDTDLDITLQRYREAWNKLLQRARSWDYQRVLLPFGNDFVNIDSIKNETTNGTPQDTDGRYHKIVEVATDAVTELISVLSSHSHVDVVLVPGNHDYLVSWNIATTLEARFQHNERVSVDRTPSPRKHYLFGKCHFMLTHGNNEKLTDLPNIMATERPDYWAGAVCREIHMGHLHTRKQFRTQDVDERCGVVIRYMPSISGSDLWHFQKGYVGNKACAEAHLYCPDEGYIGNVIS